MVTSRERGAGGPDIGTALKDARRRIGMDVKEAEERTKIRARYLRALEAEDWEALPAPAYVRGFLRTYGALLGLDGEHLADEYRRRYEEPAAASPAPETLLQERRRSGPSRTSSRGPLIGAVLAGIVVLLVVLGLFGNGNDEGQSTGGKGMAKGKSGHGNGKGKASKDQGDKSHEDKALEPIDLGVEPLEQVRLCVVGGSHIALIDSQMPAVGAVEQFAGEKTYRVDLQTGGALRISAGEESEKATSDGHASFEADSNGIREIDYAGPDCP
jgi:cytoskeleton protein RodZ